MPSSELYFWCQDVGIQWSIFQELEDVDCLLRVKLINPNVRDVIICKSKYVAKFVQLCVLDGQQLKYQKKGTGQSHLWEKVGEWDCSWGEKNLIYDFMLSLENMWQW